MRYLASRIAVAGSLVFLNLWIASALVGTGALAAGNFGLAAALARPAWTTDLPLFGFLGLMVFGLGFQFVPLFAGRDMVSPRGAIAPVILGIASVVVSLSAPRLPLYGRLVWFGATILFVGLILTSAGLGALRSRPPPADRLEGIRILDRRAAFMTGVAAVYLLVGSAGFALTAPGGPARVPALAAYSSSFTHLFTLGFLFLAIAGVALHLLARFWDVVPPARAVLAVAALGALCPAGIASTFPSAGTDGPLRYVFIGFALGQGFAALSFASIILWMWRRSQTRRPAAPFFILGSLWLVAGVGLGAYVAGASGAALRSAPIHSWASLFGFSGFVIFGITHEILPPYANRGLRAWGRAVRLHRVAATLGLALAILSQFLALAGYPRSAYATGLMGFGLLLGMTLSYFAGTFATLAALSPPPGSARPIS